MDLNKLNIKYASDCRVNFVTTYKEMDEIVLKQLKAQDIEKENQITAELDKFVGQTFSYKGYDAEVKKLTLHIQLDKEPNSVLINTDIDFDFVDEPQC